MTQHLLPFVSVAIQSGSVKVTSNCQVQVIVPE